ncbi:hypothetical protein ACFQ10_51415 [Streptomyces indonesiensis]
MRANLDSDGGLVMAESHMITLAGPVGRERAHDLVHEAATRTRTTGAHLTQTLRDVLAEHHLDTLLPGLHAQSENYLGQAHQTTETTTRLWRTQTTSLPEPPTPSPASPPADRPRRPGLPASSRRLSFNDGTLK